LQNPFTLGATIERLRTAALPWCNRRQAFLVEAGDQVGDRITRTASGSMCRFRVVLAIGHGQQRLGPRDLAGWFAGRTADLGQHLSLFIRQDAQRVDSVAGHLIPPIAGLTRSLLNDACYGNGQTK
jgi:hypothetical protein